MLALRPICLAVTWTATPSSGTKVSVSARQSQKVGKIRTARLRAKPASVCFSAVIEMTNPLIMEKPGDRAQAEPEDGEARDPGADEGAVMKNHHEDGRDPAQGVEFAKAPGVGSCFFQHRAFHGVRLGMKIGVEQLIIFVPLEHSPRDRGRIQLAIAVRQNGLPPVAAGNKEPAPCFRSQDSVPLRPWPAACFSPATNAADLPPPARPVIPEALGWVSRCRVRRSPRTKPMSTARSSAQPLGAGKRRTSWFPPSSMAGTETQCASRQRSPRWPTPIS